MFRTLRNAHHASRVISEWASFASPAPAAYAEHWATFWSVALNNKDRRAQSQIAISPRIGLLSAALGIVAFMSAILAGVISFTTFNPPDWVRFGTLALLALGFLGSGILGMLGLQSPQRVWAVIGLVLFAMSTMTCVAMLFLGQ